MPDDRHIATLADLKEGHGDNPAEWPLHMGNILRRIADSHREEAGYIEKRAARGLERAVTASERRQMTAHLNHADEIEAAAEQVGERERIAGQILAEAGQTGEAHERRSGGFTASGRGGEGVYARGSGNSFFLDLARQRFTGDPLATVRLQQHHADTDRAIASGALGQEYRVNPNRTDGQGGYFVPPAWLMDQYVTLARPARVTANLAFAQTLPAGTDSINIPKIATGTATAIQTADAAAVQSTDMTDAAITAPVRTIAGQQDIAMQLLEQSPGNFDEVIFRDLIADYNQKLDIQVLSGTNASGQLLGIFNVSGINAVTYTDATPTLPELWPLLAQAKSAVDKGIFMPSTAIIMHPSRWNWILSILDTQSRPFVVPTGAFNAMGIQSDNNPQGQAGTLLNLPVYLDPNIPQNLGGGTNEDRVVVARPEEWFLYEGALRTRALMEVLSGTLQVRLQVYNYMAFTAERRPKAISVLSGTGMISPAGF